MPYSTTDDHTDVNPTDTKSDTELLTEWTQRHYDSSLASVVRALRDMADRVEREGVPRDTPGAAGTPRFADAAENALHAITWGLANANADRLISAAAHADAAEAGS